MVSIIGPLLEVAASGVMISLGARVIDVVREYYATRGKLKATEVAEFEKILRTDDLVVLRRYFRDRLGDFAVRELTREDVRQQLDAVLDRAERFVGPEIGAAEGVPERTGVTQVPAAARSLYLDMQGDEIWTSLARTRRMIETELKGLANRVGVPVRDGQGAGRILTTLVGAGVLPNGAEEPLRFAIVIASRAIHGEDVPVDQAEEALKAAAVGIQLLRRPPMG